MCRKLFENMFKEWLLRQVYLGVQGVAASHPRDTVSGLPLWCFPIHSMAMDGSSIGAIDAAASLHSGFTESIPSPRR